MRRLGWLELYEKLDVVSPSRKNSFEQVFQRFASDFACRIPQLVRLTLNSLYINVVATRSLKLKRSLKYFIELWSTMLTNGAIQVGRVTINSIIRQAMLSHSMQVPWVKQFST